MFTNVSKNERYMKSNINIYRNMIQFIIETSLFDKYLRQIH